MTSTSPPLTSLKPESEQPLELSWVRLTFFTVCHLVACLAPWFFSWSAVGVALLFHWLCGSIGICLSYHRLLSHRSFNVPQWLEYILATIGTLALQAGPIFWVAGHRRHHAHSDDVVRDPHASTRGFWWSHMLWLMYRKAEFFDRDQYQKFAPDLSRHAYYQWLDRYYIIPTLVLGTVLYVAGGWSFVIYGIFVRSVLLWHSTWFVNSATHFWGYRNFDAKDESLNLWWVAVLAYGEGWHNNHHAQPSVAQAGLKWWEFDMTWGAIRLLEVVGLAQKVKRFRLSTEQPN